jgi:hypothetical protein
MSAINEITGDSITSKSSEKYRENYDGIFRKQEPKCDHTYVPKMDSYRLVCVKCGQQEGTNE